MKLLRILSPLLFLLTALFGLSACGGSSSDNSIANSDFAGSASVSLRVRPQMIDTGDVTRVIVNIGDINENGTIVKVRYPTNFTYVPETSILEVGNNQDEFEPRIIARNSSQKFQVYFIEPDDLGRREQGDISFLLEGRSVLNSGEIAVDADANDPTDSDDTEFSITDPKFNAEDSVEVEIIG